MISSLSPPRRATCVWKYCVPSTALGPWPRCKCVDAKPLRSPGLSSLQSRRPDHRGGTLRCRDLQQAPKKGEGRWLELGDRLGPPGDDDPCWCTSSPTYTILLDS